jgi:hypothetical protein
MTMLKKINLWAIWLGICCLGGAALGLWGNSTIEWPAVRAVLGLLFGLAVFFITAARTTGQPITTVFAAIGAVLYFVSTVAFSALSPVGTPGTTVVVSGAVALGLYMLLSRTP